MKLLAPLRILAAIAALALPATAQVQAFGGSAPRMAATRFYFDTTGGGFKCLGSVCAQYGQPVWQDKYDAMLDSLKGKQLRLGKDYWTTFNNSVPLTIGDLELPAGAWYLGLKCDAQGTFSLAFLDAMKADKKGFVPFDADAWEVDHLAPMKRTAGENLVEKMTMDLNADANHPELLTFVVSWGKHQLSVGMKAHIAAPKAGG